MRTLSSNPRVLLSTCYRRFRGDYYDTAGEAIYGLPRITALRRISPGLRFIKQNVPEVEILEHPLWHKYLAKLKEGWDVVGFSFYQNEIDEIERMVFEARRQGVRAIWAGNYGALDDKVSGMVDRVFLGPGENQIANVFGYEVRDEEIEHPPMMLHMTLIPGNIRHLTAGLLYTQHGCPFKCTFCQTPVFDNRRFTISFESIARVLRYYKKCGIIYLVIMDELFGSNPSFTDQLTDLLARYDFGWLVQTRVTLALRNLDVWYERGLRIPIIGIESMTQNCLDLVGKRQRVEEVVEYARRSRDKPGLFRLANLMIGHENMTAEDTLRDAVLTKQLGFDRISVPVLTPYPKTPLWDKLDSKYGIFDRTYRHYDNRHLVWRHPHISAPRMRDLKKELTTLLNKPLATYAKGFSRVLLSGTRQKRYGSSWLKMIKSPIASMIIDDRKQIFFPKLAEVNGKKSTRPT